MEKWKEVKGYEGLYEVSTDGRVRSVNRIDGRGRRLKGVMLKPQKDSQDHYLMVSLNKDGVKKSIFIHRLVAEMFLPNPDNLPQINHLDENKHNNRLSNLEWCTPSRNINYGNHNRLVAEAHAKPVCQYSKDGAFVASYKSAREASRITGITQGSISHVVNGDRQHAGGYIWRNGAGDVNEKSQSEKKTDNGETRPESESRHVIRK